MNVVTTMRVHLYCRLVRKDRIVFYLSDQPLCFKVSFCHTGYVSRSDVTVTTTYMTRVLSRSVITVTTPSMTRVLSTSVITVTTKSMTRILSQNIFSEAHEKKYCFLVLEKKRFYFTSLALILYRRIYSKESVHSQSYWHPIVFGLEQHWMSSIRE